jgi:O-antigen ligase/tetratricopeptide (TPR) repeat protein
MFFNHPAYFDFYRFNCYHLIVEKNDNWIARLLRYAVYITAFVPLIIFSQFISPFHFGKVVVFRSLVEIMAVFYLVLVIKDRSYLPTRHPLLIIFALFALLFGVSSVTSVNPYLSFWGSLERMGGLWTFLHYLVYFIILISVFKTKEDWFRLLKVMVLVGVLSAFYGFGQKTNISFFVGSGERARIFGTIGNAALFAGYQIVNLFLALILAFSSSISPKYKPYFFIAAAINLIAVLMTAVRGSILGVGVGFLVFTFLYFFSSKSRIAKQVLTGLVILLVLFVALSFALKNSNFVKNSPYLSRITDFSLQTYTVQTRFWAWRAGLEGWKENPKTILLGWGPENFNVPFSKHFNPKFFKGIGSETLFDRAHNMFVEVLVTMGLLGFLAYISIFLVAYRLIWRNLKKTEFPFYHDRDKMGTRSRGMEPSLGIGLISLITAYIIHNCFIFDTSANFIVFFTVLGFIVFLTPRSTATTAPWTLNSKFQTPNPKQIPNSKFQTPNPKLQTANHRLGIGLQTLMLVLLVGAALLIYKTNILPVKANYATTRAIIKSWAKDFDGAVAKYKEALSYNVPGKYDYRHRYAQYILEYTTGKKIEEKERNALLFGIAEVRKNIEETKEDYLPYLYVSRMFINLGKDDPDSPYNDEALKNSMKALEISPTFVRTYYEIAQAYLNKKDYGNAIKYFSESVKLNPEVGMSYWYLGATYLEAGETQKGLAAIDEAMKVGYALSESDYQRLINIYLKQNSFAKIVELYEALIKIKPGNPQYHASLAVAYAKIGKIDEAVSEAKKAAALDKTFEKEARMFVESLGRKY